ncbi:MAG: gamma-butyrobetaine hydroxylase-like domain-containing protein, partial [Pseudomonadota bacterium]
MTTALLRGEDRVLSVVWPNGTSADFPFLWLRDNCPSGFHPDTQERQFDLTSISPDLTASDVSVDAGNIVITWEGESHTSHFDPDWLFRHRPGIGLADPAKVEPTFWHGDFPQERLPRASASALMSDDTALLDFLVEAKTTGLAFVDGMSDDANAGMTMARRIGFLRETNFGTTFEVQSKPNPNNLAYTSDA